MALVPKAPLGPSAARPRNQAQVFALTRPVPAGIDVLLAHPDPGGRSALHGVLDRHAELRIVAVTGDGDEAAAEAERLRPAVALVDDRLSTAARAQRIARMSRLILLTVQTEPDVIATMLLGPARGCLTYDQLEPDDLRNAVRAVANGLAWLSPAAVSAATSAMRAVRPTAPGPVEDHGLTCREREVLELLCRGMSNAAIAIALTLTEKTVKNHLSRSFAKLGVHSRGEAVRRLNAALR
jgi:DNA-binding NarL/FixJ family response regulator